MTFHDALYDSDEELEHDENARLDYREPRLLSIVCVVDTRVERRLEVLRMIRGRDVTPPREVAPGAYISDNDEAEREWQSSSSRRGAQWDRGEPGWHESDGAYAQGY